MMMKSRILYEDSEFLVCYKPAGLSSQTAKVGEADLVSEIRNYLKSPYAGLINRLDQPVEGLVLVATNPRAAKELSAQMNAGRIQKLYYAVAAGIPDPPEGTLIDFLIRDGRTNLSVVCEEGGKDVKKAVLDYRVVSGGEASLLEILLKTGRHHQIRVQLSHAGYPILGDTKYGTEESVMLSREKKVTSIALCAAKLEFLHPKSGKKLSFSVKPEGTVFLPYIGSV